MSLESFTTRIITRVVSTGPTVSLVYDIKIIRYIQTLGSWTQSGTLYSCREM